MPNVAFWTIKKKAQDCSGDGETQAYAKSSCCWRTRRPGRLGLPVPNVAFWIFLECQEESQMYRGDGETGFETLNPDAAEGRGGPVGWGCQCLTLLSGMSRRKPKPLWEWRNAGFETPNPMLLKDAAARPAGAASAYRCFLDGGDGEAEASKCQIPARSSSSRASKALELQLLL